MPIVSKFLGEIHVMWLKCHVRRQNLHFKRMLITGLLLEYYTDRDKGGNIY